MKISSLLILFVMWSGFVSANSEAKKSVTTEKVTSYIESTIDKSSDITFTENDKTLAKQWMLTESDWIKYKKIMAGPRGVWSPGLDPITALGVSETDPQERKRYAEIWIKIESRRAELEFAFDVERRYAGSRVLGDQLAVNNTKWVKEWKEKKQATHKQVVFFVEASCKEKCKAMFDELYSSVGDNAKLDIFFRKGASSDDIGIWASFMNISPDLVRSRKITLNFDEGKSQSLKVDTSTLPQVRVIDVQTGETTSTYQ